MTEHPRILLIDSNPESSRSIEEVMKFQGYQFRQSPKVKESLHIIQAWNPHIVLVDMESVEGSLKEFIKKIRQLTRDEYASVILIAQQEEEEFDQVFKSFENGADDFLEKPYDMAELKARVVAGLRIKVLQDSLRRANKKVEEAMTYDDLTGLRNMRYSLKKLEEEIVAAKKSSSMISCIIFDMDHFKQVNDRQDHLFGSYVLREAIQAILPRMRPADIMARYGGDEFFIILPKTNVRDAIEIANNIRKTIEEHKFKHMNYTVRITASFGVSGTSVLKDLEQLDSKELIRSADLALYSAKKSGRNKVESSVFCEVKATAS